MKEKQKPQRSQRKPLCSQKEFPLKDITKQIIHKIYEAQLLTYLRAMNKRVGLLIDFNVLRLKDDIKRLIGCTHNIAN